MGGVDDDVQAYIDAIEPPEHRAMFDRVDGIVRAEVPDVEMLISYKMPTYKAGNYRLYVAAWKHGLSIYGWGEDGDGGFIARHPELKTHKGTIKVGPADLAGVSDDELRSLVRASLLGV